MSETIDENKIRLRKMQEAIRAKKIAQRDAYKLEKETYESAKSAISDIINSIIECEANLGETYEKISVGIVCADVSFSSNTENIKKYQKQLILDKETLLQISSEINDEIQELTNKINKLNSEIY